MDNIHKCNIFATDGTKEVNRRKAISENKQMTPNVN